MMSLLLSSTSSTFFSFNFWKEIFWKVLTPAQSLFTEICQLQRRCRRRRCWRRRRCHRRCWRRCCLLIPPDRIIPLIIGRAFQSKRCVRVWVKERARNPFLIVLFVCEHVVLCHLYLSLPLSIPIWIPIRCALSRSGNSQNEKSQFCQISAHLLVYLICSFWSFRQVVQIYVNLPRHGEL